MHVDDSKGVTSYEGNARARVANVLIETESILIFRHNGSPARIAASGNPLMCHQKESSKNLSGTVSQLIFSIPELKLKLIDYSISDSTGNNLKGEKATFVLRP